MDENNKILLKLENISKSFAKVENDEVTVSYRITCNNGNQRTLINP